MAPDAGLHRAANESTARRAVFYAFLEAGGLVAVSVVQARARGEVLPLGGVCADVLCCARQVMLVKRLFEGKQSRSSSSSAARFGTPAWGV